jgi:hypothetical protein
MAELGAPPSELARLKLGGARLPGKNLRHVTVNDLGKRASLGRGRLEVTAFADGHLGCMGPLLCVSFARESG